MNVMTATRDELEMAVLEHDILPTGTSADCAKVIAMTTAEIRAVVAAWVEAGDETDRSCR